MAKRPIIVASSTGEKVPFLRGILVQSLTGVGLSFEDAYAAAQRIRESLAELEETDTASLRERVAELLGHDVGPEVRRAYLASQRRSSDVVVRTLSREAPFSVGILSRYLEGCAVGRKQALNGARKVQKSLLERRFSAVGSKELRRIVFETLALDCGPEVAGRYLSRCRFEDSGKPLIILIGGAAGAGKSTVAADLAYHLEISRTQSTDIIREVVRSYLPTESAPTLAYSSFEAWRGLAETAALGHTGTQKSAVIQGFLSQIGAITAGLEATIGRAAKERQDLVLDGVHVVPAKLNLSEVEEKAIIVPFTLAVATPNRLSLQLGRRSIEQPERESSRQQENLDAVWEIQRYLLDQAEQNDTPVLLNWSVNETVRGMLKIILDRIGERFPPDPASLG